MPVRSSERPTIAPSFDLEEYARESEKRVTAAAPATARPGGFVPEAETKSSEVRIATRPQWVQVLTHEAWARSMKGAPVVTMTGDSLKRLPLDHRAGFVMSLMDGSIDLDTIIELCGMERDEALSLVRDLHDSGVVVFR
jgi:hypothetical protein